MADFPLFIKMDGRKVMVIGGGSVALTVQISGLFREKYGMN